MASSVGFSDSLDLLRRAKRGDDGALHALLERYRARLLARIRLMMGERARSAADSGDYLHGVFAELLVRFDGFEAIDERSFLRWATTIARNGIRAEVRRRRERTFASLSNSGVVRTDADGHTPSPASEADARDKLFRLAEALEELDEDQRELIELRDLEGLSFAAIGDRLGCSGGGARLRYHRALVDLGRRATG